MLTLNMPRDHLLLLWLLMELGQFYLIPVVSETVITGYLGRSVKLPCHHPSWAPDSNSMCWGKGPCPNSKCKDELAHTDGTRVLSRASSRYSLRGAISRGDVSLTISSTRESDSSVYCCRIEVPGWFNDVKKNIRLQLRKAPVVPRTTTTRRPPTTTITMTKTWTPSMALLPTTGVPAPHLTTAAPQQITTQALTEAATCPLSTESSPPAMLPTLATEHTTSLTLATEPATEGATHTSAEAETAPTVLQSPLSITSGTLNKVSLSSREPQAWVLITTPSQLGTTMWDMSHKDTFSEPGETDSPIRPEEMEQKQNQVTDHRDLLMIILPSLGLLLFLVLLGTLLRGKITKTICFQKHTRLEDSRESKQGLGNLQPGREDEDGLFTL